MNQSLFNTTLALAMRLDAQKPRIAMRSATNRRSNGKDWRLFVETRSVRLPERSKVSTDSVDNSWDNLFNQLPSPEQAWRAANWLLFNHLIKNDINQWFEYYA